MYSIRNGCRLCRSIYEYYFEPLCICECCYARRRLCLSVNVNIKVLQKLNFNTIPICLRPSVESLNNTGGCKHIANQQCLKATAFQVSGPNPTFLRQYPSTPLPQPLFSFHLLPSLILPSPFHQEVAAMPS